MQPKLWIKLEYLEYLRIVQSFATETRLICAFILFRGIEKVYHTIIIKILFLISMIL